jgi:thiol-disulfide isomerase/thioredoxin
MTHSLFAYCLIVTLAFAGCAEKVDAPDALVEGSIAPEVTNITYLQGDAVEYGTKAAYLIEFWATWCAPCKESAPVLSRLQAEYKDRGLLVAGFSDETETIVKSYLAAYGANIAYTIGLDPDGVVQKNFIDGYGEMGIPWAFLLDGDGTLIWVGHPMAEELEVELAKLLPEPESGD